MSSIGTAPKEMATLTESIKLYDKLPTREDDEKSSDEESFHLPIDDEEAEKRDITLNGKDESEDDILDKFEDANGPEIDPQLEESLLEETDEATKPNIENTEKTSTKKEENSETSSESVSKLVSNETTAQNCDDTKSDDYVNEENKECSDNKKEEDLKKNETFEKDTIIAKNTIVEKDTVPEIDTIVEKDANVEKDTIIEEVNKTGLKENDENVSEIKECVDNEVIDKEVLLNTEKKEEQEEKMECNKVNGDKNIETEDTQGVEDTKKTDEESKESSIQDVEKPEKTEESSEKVETMVAESEKCENSNDSSKSTNSESDLLDISIIRDVEEDDANAREEHAKDVELTDKVENEEEESCDKVSESDVDNEHQEVLEKEEQMEFDEESSSKEDETSVIESEVKQPEDIVEPAEEADKAISETEKTSTIKDVSVNINGEAMEESPIEENLEDKDEAKEKEVENESIDNELASKDKTAEPAVKSGKRSLSEADSEIANKKIKLAESEKELIAPVDIESEKPLPPEEPSILSSFASFMKNKKVSTKLTRSDLEQFCLQKICEAIIHKTDVGELHQKIKQYEGTIDQLRKDVTQLTKQARDLEIVNKKLMNELKVQNGNKKPLVPLKITRSVGLQVKLNFPPDNPRKRLSTNNSPQKPGNVTPGPATRVIRANQPNVRQVGSPQKTMLSKALQPRRPGVVTPVTQKQQPQKRPGPQPRNKINESKSASVIDLTDEDGPKKSGRLMPLSQMKTVTVSQNKTIPVGNNKTITVNQTKTIPLNQQKSSNVRTTIPQGMRLTPTQLKNGNITLPGVVTSSAPLMYVVQPTSSLNQGIMTTTAGGTQKAVIVNFQPTNGVLTSTLNGSAVSVIPTKTANTVQLKTHNPRKHPAPLPMAPVRVAGSMDLKPIPPKPHLSIRKTDTGIMLQWKMPYSLDNYETIASYQLYAYQETNSPPSTDMWRRVGDVKALALPMACTLVQFADKNKYYFAVRSVDVHKRIGPFSDPEEISL
ncbi:unnamed protein product [Brassicogethes aeneus]|nr:unnamed protein product [Brassicogethes aeneus]